MVLHESSPDEWLAYWPDRESGALLWANYVPGGERQFTCEQANLQSNCSKNFQVSNGEVKGEPVRMEMDPYAIGLAPSPEGGTPFLITGGLLDPRVTLWSLGEEGTPELSDQRVLANGLSGVAVHPQSKQPYMTAQYAQAVYPMTLALDPEDQRGTIEAVSIIRLPNETRIGQPIYGQNIAFSPAGDLAFVAYRYPSSVAIIDVSPNAQGVPSNTAIGFVETGGKPTDVAYVTHENGEDILYVSSSTKGSVYAYQAPEFELVDTIPVGRGSGSMAWVRNNDLGTQRLYVSLFEEAGVSVIDIDPTSVWYHEHIATIR
jgi:DNA-binding beta-propeller fold protein YncE